MPVLLGQRPYVGAGIDVVVVVEVFHRLRLQYERGGEHAASVLQRGHALAVGGSHRLALPRQGAGCGGVQAADEELGFVARAVRAAGKAYFAVVSAQPGDLRLAKHFAALCPDAAYQRAGQLRGAALQPPAAFEVAAVPVDEGEQRERLAAQFHLQGGAAQHVDEQRVAEQALQVLPGVGFHQAFGERRVCRSGGVQQVRLVCRGLLQQAGILLQGGAFVGEVGGERLHEVVVALGKGKGLPADGHPVEQAVHPLPGQSHQSQVAEHGVHGRALVQSAHVVETGVEVQPLPAVRLHAAARLCPLLQHEHVQSGACQDAGAEQSAQSAADDDDVMPAHASLP